MAYIVRSFIEEKTRKCNQLFDDFTKGFIWGYAMGKKRNSNESTTDYAKYRIPHLLTAEALFETTKMKIQLS